MSDKIGSRARECILIVDDDAHVRQLASRVLDAEGYEILEASNGNEAMLICREHTTPIHLVISDVVMPKYSGHRLASEILALRSDARILLVSGYPMLSGFITRHITRSDASRMEAGILSKPFSAEELKQTVRRLLDRPLPISA